MSGKITASHLARRAFVYVRQSTTTQVVEHRESTQRQYALADRAVSLGWVREAVEVIDEDQGRSGTSIEGRGGFVRLAEGVAHGEAGAVFALEVSRLARSSEDWRRLLSLCAVAQVLVIDEQTIYDCSAADDKLLLDLKGTMSQAELDWLRLRLAGARRNKARRGELRLGAPAGYVWGEHGFELDADESVQRAVRSIFERFAVEPSASAVVRWARQEGLEFPRRRTSPEGTSQVEWKPLGVSRLIAMLHSPIYAGAYVYGRAPEREVLVNGEIRRVRREVHDPARWAVRIEGAHPGYISWETYLKNRERLRQNATAMGEAAQGAPREGPSLLNGLVLCGRCGRRMHTAYGGRGSRKWFYRCRGDWLHGGGACWSVPGKGIDRAVETLFLETMVPSELELSLAVEREVERQAEDVDQQWRARFEQATYEARRAERRYKSVDPENRVVARTLEREWEERLRALEGVGRQYAEAKRSRHLELSEQDRARIRALARDLPALWRAPTTQPADRKAMLRLVLEAVSISPVEVPRRSTRVRVQWQSGAVTELEVARPDCRSATRNPERVVERIREMAGAGERDERIAERLNAEGLRTGLGNSWNRGAVLWVRRSAGIPRVAPDAPRSLPLPERHPDGRYSVAGASKCLRVTPWTVRVWLARGLLSGSREDYGPHRGVWWVELDELTATGLAERAGGWRRAPRRDGAPGDLKE